MPEEKRIEGNLTEEIQAKKILRVPNNFGDEVPTVFTNQKNSRFFLQLFEAHGYVIVRGGVPSEQEWGINFSGPETDSYMKRSEKKSAELGIFSPRSFRPEEILSAQEAVVAKLPIHRGEQKYLLETREQKARFLALALLGQSISDLDLEYLYKRKDSEQLRQVIENLIEAVKKGNLDHPLFRKGGILKDYKFEEFIVTPTDFLTSFRVIVDGLGRIHYGVVYRVKRGEFLDDCLSPHEPLVARPGEPIAGLLLDPRSPFYLHSQSIVSNSGKEEPPIFLDGKMQNDPQIRKVMAQLSLDPDNPDLPDKLKAVCSALGRLNRAICPFIGVDFILGTDGRFRFLEVNHFPQIEPRYIGLSENTDFETVYGEMLNRIL